MDLKHSMRFALHGCVSGVLPVAHWVVRSLLVVGLGLQFWAIAFRGLELPEFASRALERRLAFPEITVRFGRTVFDPTGRVLFEQVQLFGPDRSLPLITARAACVRLELLPLLIGEIRVREIRLTGVDLRVPAMLSPSGADETVVSDLDGIFEIQRSDYRIALCTFRIAGVAVASRGRFHLPAGTRSGPGSMRLLDLVFDRCLKAGRQLIALQPRIEALEEPRMQLTFTPSPDSGAIVEAELLVDSSHSDASFNVRCGRARAIFPLLGGTAVPTEVTIDAERVVWKEQARVARLHAAFSGSLIPDRFAFTPLKARMTAAGGSFMDVPFAAPAAELALAGWPRVNGDAVLQAGGAPMAAHADVETERGDGRIDLSASLTPDLLRLAATRFGMTAARKVTLGGPASLQVRVDLAGGWKPTRVEGDLSVRCASVQDVPIDAAGGHIVYAGHGIEVTDLTLFQGDNAAFGSYAMDTTTHEYRFLLHGRLRPLDISGWFKDWWPRFWRGFNFAAAPPAADIDLAGRWGTARETVLFCHADVAQPGIRGVPFDRVRTTLFFRPNYFDVSEFKLERSGHAGSGSFTVAVDPDDSTLRTLEFDAGSDLDVAECARLYGPEGVALAAPLQFAEPPTVRLAGHLAGPTAPGGAHAQMHFTMAAASRVTMHGFPLDTVRFSADYNDGDLVLPDIEAGFAGGAVTAHAHAEGLPGGARSLLKRS